MPDEPVPNAGHRPPAGRSDWAVLFDWDGVVIDSRAAHEESWRLLFRELGRVMPEDFFMRTFGMRNQQIIPQCFEFVDPADQATIESMGRRKEVLYREILIREGIEPLPGLMELLDSLDKSGVARCVASSTPHENIATIMRLTSLTGRFDAVVAAEDVERGKPDPDVFLRAAEKVGQPPRRCVVIEDAHVGIRAARAAGMPVLAVATTHPADSLHGATRVLSGLGGVTAATLHKLLATAD